MARALSLNGTKEAALFFEEVLPFDAIIGSIRNREWGRFSSDQCVPFDSDPDIAYEVLSSLLPRVSDPHRIGLDILAFQMAAVLSIGGINMMDGLQVEAATEALDYLNTSFGTKIKIEDFLKQNSSPKKFDFCNY